MACGDNSLVLTEQTLFASPMAQNYPELRKLTPYSRVETEYIGILRGPAVRWWKPLLAMLLAGAIYLFLSTLVVVPIIVETIIHTGSGAGHGNATITALSDLDKRLENSADPFGIATALLSIACFIPSVMLANMVIFRARPGTLGSVAGRLRWRLLGKYLAVILFPYIVFILGLPIISGVEIIVNPKPTFWFSLIVILLLAPLQAAAEEYFFRGWFYQTCGSWFKNVRLAWFVLVPVGGIIFVIAHAAADIYINIQLGIFALVASVLVWRTGGLEASIALHILNNTLLFILDALSGGASNSSPRSQTSTLSETLVFLLFIVIIAVILWAVFAYGEKRLYYRRIYKPNPIPSSLWEQYQQLYEEQVMPIPPVSGV